MASEYATRQTPPATSGHLTRPTTQGLAVSYDPAMIPVMRRTDQLDDLFAIIQDACRLQDINTFLQQYKDDHPTDIRVSASGKSAAMDNLQRPARSGIIPAQDLKTLIRDVEENGDQHIRYYVPTERQHATFYGRATSLAATLLGQSWETDQRFPCFDPLPQEPVLADFRIDPSTNGSAERGWLLKVYGSEMAMQSLGKKKRRNGNVVEEWCPTLKRTVSIARWHKSGMLELRVPRWEKRSTIEEMFGKLWKLIGPAVNASHFEPWDLSKVRTKMVAEEGKWQAVYRFPDATFKNEMLGKMRLSTRFSSEHLMDVPVNKSAIQAYLKEHGLCEALVVRWLPDGSAGALHSELGTVIGVGDLSNEIIVPGKTTSKAVDYVTHRLREFAQ